MYNILQIKNMYNLVICHVRSSGVLSYRQGTMHNGRYFIAFAIS